MKVFPSILALATLGSVACWIVWSDREAPDETILGRPVPQWIVELSAPEYHVRTKAQAALKKHPAVSIPHLARVLRDRDSELYRKLAALLDHHTPLRIPTKDKAQSRVVAAGMLARFGAEAAPAIPDLIGCLGDSASSVRREAAHALSSMKQAPVQQLGAALLEGPIEVRVASARVLRDLGPAATGAIPEMLQALGSDHPDLRRATAIALGTSRTPTRKTIDALTAAFDDPDAGVREAAAEAIGLFGQSATRALPALAGHLKDPEPRVQFKAAEAIWRIDRRKSLILPTLIRALDEDSLRWESALLIGRMGEQGAEAVPGLIAAMKREELHRPFRTPPVTSFALGKIGHKALPQLIVCLGTENARSRAGAAFALLHMGDDAFPAIPALKKTLADPSADVRHASALTLADLGDNHCDLLPVLQEMLEVNDDAVRSMAIRAIRNIDPELAWQNRNLE